MVTDPGAHRLRRHSEQALRFPCVGWMAETGIVDEASWTGRDTSKRQELPRFKHDLPHPTSLESGKVFRNHESSDSPLAVPYQINPFGFSMQANFVRMRGLTPFAFEPKSSESTMSIKVVTPHPMSSFALLLIRISRSRKLTILICIKIQIQNIFTSKYQI